MWLYGFRCSSFLLSVSFLRVPDLLRHNSIFTLHYLSAAAPRHRTRPGPCRQNTAACPPLAAPCRSGLRMTAAAPDTLCDLMERKKRRVRTWELTQRRASTTTTHYTFLSSLVDGGRQLVGGLGGGAVLQDESDTGSTSITAGVEEGCGTIC